MAILARDQLIDIKREVGIVFMTHDLIDVYRGTTDGIELPHNVAHVHAHTHPREQFDLYRLEFHPPSPTDFARHVVIVTSPEIVFSVDGVYSIEARQELKTYVRKLFDEKKYDEIEMWQGVIHGEVDSTWGNFSGGEALDYVEDKTARIDFKEFQRRMSLIARIGPDNVPAGFHVNRWSWEEAIGEQVKLGCFFEGGVTDPRMLWSIEEDATKLVDTIKRVPLDLDYTVRVTNRH
jgi:hypothetical protein